MPRTLTPNLSHRRRREKGQERIAADTARCRGHGASPLKNWAWLPKRLVIAQIAGSPPKAHKAPHQHGVGPTVDCAAGKGRVATF